MAKWTIFSDTLSAEPVLVITSVPLSPSLKANVLLKLNIDALLEARGQTRPELARWCRRSRSWLDKAFGEDRREIPLKYLDRIAVFFGIATYQLFQPGISPLTERRLHSDRRSGRYRRLSQAVLSEKPGDVDLMHLFRAMSRGGREKAIGFAADIVNDELQRRPATRHAHDDPDHTEGTPRRGTPRRPGRPKGSKE